MSRLADVADQPDDHVRDALAREAGRIRDDTAMPQAAVEAHLHALRGWARIAAQLPLASAQPDDPRTRAWRCIDELLLGLYRAAPDPRRADELWQRLLTEEPAAGVNVLRDIRHACYASTPYETADPHHLLYAAYPDQVRALLEWALTHRGQAADGQPHFEQQQLDRYVVQGLGDLGTVATSALLQDYVLDPDLGPQTVDAIRAIDRRTARCDS